MKHRKVRYRIDGEWFSANLESRTLPSAGMVAIVDVVRDLGSVSATAAARGVEATATIPAGTAVTFEFSLQTAGDYTLLVRHTGDDLTLRAKWPTGTATIDPGAAGPFQILPLSLQAQTYEVTASAAGKTAVAVDWELLLNSGVGQAASTAIGSLVPAVAIPVSGTAASPSAAAAPATLAPSATSFEPLVEARGELSVGSIARGIMGHPSVDGTRTTESMVENSVGSLAYRALVESDTALVVAMQTVPGAASGQPDIPAAATDGMIEHSSNNPHERAAEAIAGDPATESLLAEWAAASVEPEPAGERISLASITPGLLLGAIAVTVAYRARPRGHRPRFDRTATSRLLTSTEATIRCDGARLDRLCCRG